MLGALFFWRTAGCALALGVSAGSVLASGTYPNKPIRVIVPYAAGGVVDVQTRALTEALHEVLGQVVVVEARPGASGNIAARQIAAAEPDGYTLMVSASFLINNPLLEKNLPWKPDDFTPIARFALSASYFVVPANSPANNVKEFADLARQAVPSWQYGNGGTGTPQTMSNELFRVVADIPLESVMYKGAPPIVPDLVNGLVSMAVLPSSVAIPHVQSGTIRALANVSNHRSIQLPDVPTIAEAGFPEVTTLSWYGLHAPAGTPETILRALSDAVNKACQTVGFQQRIVNAGGEAACMNTNEFQQFLDADAKRWSELVKVIQP
ncbi:tripartite tricarboxylate transporter substrate binding protein [Alcaligenes endophyticus]|uniref:Tripartite tricarboxylate transporter substrate binding protein n=1 Tax=Alcaligenes endophyticus TaxID=1929088 RepID=A0ABT8EJG9_9BURK|nr:tripartite tricarboxylate transporter substrate binding protein [Alcaligenes endophyticus]MCX5591756.1 tripartite tricarboxylate transporter substrate binding protein [Alcaligenes endophyticus]MDN4121433.1 tripartite tricarboxylate transporter substrate binding protein [Alcaligenes endophyticus]